METPCIEWNGCKTKHGYGRKNVRGRQWKVHRWTWVQAHGPIPNGFCVLHKCDNPACFRLDHLFLGTVLDNMRDMDAKGRRVVKVGAGCKHPMAKLNDLQVERIRRDERIQRLIAADYGISQSQVSSIKTGRTWAKGSGRVCNGVFIPSASGEAA